jgi:hypothetical protein
MPQQLIAGPGLGLPLAQSGYPQPAGANAYSMSSNKIGLSPAQTYMIPAGDWIVMAAGTISAIQWLDPQRQEWVNQMGPGVTLQMRVKSDGSDWRVNNLSDSAYAATVTAAGSGYVQGSTTVTAGTGNSTWVPIVGGAVATGSITAGGKGYTIPPLVLIPAPPPPGVPATGIAVISGGTVTSITIVNAGAGYTVAPVPTLLPVQNDPAFIAGSITNATATLTLTGAGTLTAVLLGNFGGPLTTAPTLTVAGAGTTGTVTTVPAAVVAAANDTITLQPV